MLFDRHEVGGSMTGGRGRIDVIADQNGSSGKQQAVVGCRRSPVQGMVIFVTLGDPNDPTRLPEFYKSSFRYLAELGIPTLRDRNC